MEVQVLSATVQKFDGVSYYKCGEYFQKKGVRLHRKVWEHHNGEIPEGYHVHHKDGNKNNNGIDNLELLLGKGHMSLHASIPERVEKSRKSIEVARVFSKEWHKSDEGRRWHKEHGKDSWENRTEKSYVCSHCGKEFETRNRYAEDSNRFCSNNCKSAYRRTKEIDNEERICECCGGKFNANKYSKTKYCGYECARIARWGDKRSQDRQSGCVQS